MQLSTPNFSSRRVKILFASDTINENGGGISSYAIDFIKEYIEDNEILVISNDEPESKYSQIIKHHIKFPSKPITYGRILKLLEIVNNYKPDVIINSAFSIMSLAIPYFDGKTVKVSISHFVDGKLAIISGFNSRYYNNIVVLSNAGKERMMRYYPKIEPTKLVVVYNFFKSEKNQIIKKKINTPVQIVYPGGGSINKNPLLILRILKALKSTDFDFKFYWLGNTLLPGSRIFGGSYIFDMIKPDERVVFTGCILRERAIQIIQQSDIFLLPSFKEGCPITLLEAMSVGTVPIVSSSKHASSEIIKTGYNGFVLSKKNADEYVGLITEIIEQPNRFQNIIINSYDTFEKELTIDCWKGRMNLILKPGVEINPGTNIRFLRYLYQLFVFTLLLSFERFISVIRSITFFAASRFIKE